MNAPQAFTPLRLALLTSRGGGQCLHVAGQIDAGFIRGIELAAIVTDNPSAPVLDECAQRGVATHVVPWRGKDMRLQHDVAMDALLQSLDVDLVGLVGYRRLVSEPFVAQWRGRLFALHASLLPGYAGLDPIDRAFDAGEPWVGATVHWVDAGTNTGGVIAQRRATRVPQDTRADVVARVHKLEANLLTGVLNQLAVTVARRAVRRQAAALAA